MRLRIIIPSLGYSPFLVDTIESALRLPNEVIERIIIVTPNEINVSDSHRESIEIVKEPTTLQGGLYGAINYGAKQAGDWTHVTYINDDDGLLDIKVQEENNGADVIYGRVFAKYGNSNKFSALTVCSNPSYLPSVWCWNAPGLYQQGTILSRCIFEEADGFDETFKLAADHAFWINAWKLGARFQFREEYVAFFRIRQGQLSSNKLEMTKEIKRATREGGVCVSPIKALRGYVYWRLAGLKSMANRLRYGLPWRLEVGR